MKNIKTVLIFILILTLNSLEAGKIANLSLATRNPFHKLCEELELGLIVELINNYTRNARDLKFLLNHKNDMGYTALDILITKECLDINKAYVVIKTLINNNAGTSSKDIIRHFLKIYPFKNLEDLLSNAHTSENLESAELYDAREYSQPHYLNSIRDETEDP